MNSSDDERPSPQPSPGVPGEGAKELSLADIYRKTIETLRRLGPAAPMAIVVAVVPPIGFSVLVTLLSTTALAQTMRDHPSPALPIYVVAFWFLGICCLPTYAYSILGGWAFGFWPGVIAATLAYGGAMCAAFALARRFAEERVLPLIDEHPMLAAVRSAVVNAGKIRGSLLIGLLRISPASPFAITNLVLGAGGVGWTQYVIGSALGVLPRTFVLVYFASRLQKLTFKSSDGWWMITLGIVATVIAIGVIGKLARKELNRQLKSEKPMSS